MADIEVFNQCIICDKNLTRKQQMFCSKDCKYKGQTKSDEKNCNHCNKLFTAKRLYCSSECRNTHKKENRKEPENKLDETGKQCLCGLCNKPIIGKKEKFCSALCKNRMRKWKGLSKEEINKRLENLTNCICKNCGKPREKTKKMFCSDNCSRTYKKSHEEENIILKVDDNGNNIPCKLCGENIGKDKKEFCSSLCSGRYKAWKHLDDNEKQERLNQLEKFNELKEEFCKICSKPVPEKKLNCCSQQCSSKYHALKHLSEEEFQNKLNTLGSSAVCEYCDKDYIRIRSAQRYCSRPCTNTASLIEIKNKKTECRNLLKEEKQKAGKCANCDEINILLFEFAHSDRKTKTIDVHECCNIQQLEEELKLGRFLCIECHRIETMKENEEIRMKKGKVKIMLPGLKYINNQKLKIGKCTLCSKKVIDDNLFLFDFDHLDPLHKICDLARLSNSSDIEMIKKELEKTRLLCCKCHRLHTIEQHKNKLIKCK